MQIRVIVPIFEYGCTQLLQGQILPVDDELGKRLLRTGKVEFVPKRDHVALPEIHLPHAETAVLPRTYGKPKPPAKPKKRR